MKRTTRTERCGRSQGEAYLKIWIIEIEGQVLVNNEYVAGCAAINGAGAEGHYHFSDGGVGGGFFAFSNCSDQLKEFKETPATKHSGGFVKEESAHFLPRSGNAQRRCWRLGAPIATAAAGGESETFNLPEGGAGPGAADHLLGGLPGRAHRGPRRPELHDAVSAEAGRERPRPVHRRARARTRIRCSSS